MTYYFDVFGTDDFHRNVSDSDSRLSEYLNFIFQNPAADIGDYGGESIFTDSYTRDEYEVNVGANRFDNRREAADDWLQSNFNEYSTSSACIVFDYWDSLNSAYGITKDGQFNKSKDKTALINVENTPTKRVDKAVAGHEIGHLTSADHEDVYYTSVDSGYTNCTDPSPKATYMHTGDTSSRDTQCNSCATVRDRNPDPSEYEFEYSYCAEDEIERFLNN